MIRLQVSLQSLERFLKGQRESKISSHLRKGNLCFPLHQDSFLIFRKHLKEIENFKVIPNNSSFIYLLVSLYISCCFEHIETLNYFFMLGCLWSCRISARGGIFKAVGLLRVLGRSLQDFGDFL